MELNAVLRKVRSLVQRAEHPETPEGEAQTAREMADALMLKYAIDQAQVNDARPAGQKIRPTSQMMDLCPIGSPLEQNLGSLVSVIAQYTRCSIMYFGYGQHVAKKHRAFYEGRNTRFKVYGFESDVKYFELLYTTISLHLAHGIDPKPDFANDLQENAYILHNAGLNWLDISRFYGWPENGEPATTAGGRVKRAYYKACKERDETPIKIPASGRITYQRSFIRAYATRLRQRFLEVEGRRSVGSGLVLQSAMADIAAMMAEEHPDSRKMKLKREGTNLDAYQRGKVHADSADLSGTGRMAGGTTQKIGQ
jgi:hypothetical protein